MLQLYAMFSKASKKAKTILQVEDIKDVKKSALIKMPNFHLYYILIFLDAFIERRSN